MAKRARTKDESFILHLYEMVQQAQEDFKEIRIADIARCIGLNHISVKNTINMLAQANFIQKCHPDSVRLTENGKRLARSLLEQL